MDAYTAELVKRARDGICSRPAALCDGVSPDFAETVRLLAALADRAEVLATALDRDFGEADVSLSAITSGHHRVIVNHQLSAIRSDMIRSGTMDYSRDGKFAAIAAAAYGEAMNGATCGDPTDSPASHAVPITPGVRKEAAIYKLEMIRNGTLDFPGDETFAEIVAAAHGEVMKGATGPVTINIRDGQIVGTPYGPEVPDGQYVWADRLPSAGGKPIPDARGEG